MPHQHRTTSAVYCPAGADPDHGDHGGRLRRGENAGPSSPDPRLASAQPVLDLLPHQPVLLAVTLPHTVADERYDITVSKAVDDAGVVQPGFWWEVDRLAGDAQGQPHWERRWRQSLRAYETAEETNLAAVH